MKEGIIKYKDSKTLEILKSLSKYFDFKIASHKKAVINKNGYEYINNIPVIRGDSSIDVKQLNAIFTGKNLDAKKLRTEAWRRQK